jgi:tripartite-type tricarboxylate transporter receptor subunit TctC
MREMLDAGEATIARHDTCVPVRSAIAFERTAAISNTLKVEDLSKQSSKRNNDGSTRIGRSLDKMFLRKSFGPFLAAAAFVAVAFEATAAQSDDYYHGKTVTLLVGYAPGGGYDTNARLLARELGDHIPGRPRVVVENMPGAGSLRMLRFLSHEAPADGTTLGLFDFTQITNSLLTPDMVKIDFRQFKWIGSIAQDLAVCYVWKGSVRASTLAEVQKLKSLPMGRTNPSSSSDIEQKIFRKLFDVPVESVAGYAGSAEAFVAVENGELNGGCLTWSSLPADWISNGRITPILRLSSASAPDLPSNVPDAADVAKSSRDKQIIEFLTAAGKLGKPIVAPLDVPQQRIDILRKAFEDTMKDPTFLAEAKEARQPIDPVFGGDAEKILDKFYQAPPDIVTAAKQVAAD